MVTGHPECETNGRRMRLPLDTNAGPACGCMCAVVAMMVAAASLGVVCLFCNLLSVVRRVHRFGRLCKKETGRWAQYCLLSLLCVHYSRRTLSPDNSNRYIKSCCKTYWAFEKVCIGRWYGNQYTIFNLSHDFMLTY